MATIYRTRNNEIIIDGLDVVINGKNYIIDISDEENIKAHLLSRLTTLGESFDFICKYHPDYTHSEEAAWLDDLDCIIDGECDEEKTERITSEWGSDTDVWQKKREKIYSNLLHDAIDNYKTINNIK